jgi:dienelactone hydrolase
MVQFFALTSSSGQGEQHRMAAINLLPDRTVSLELAGSPPAQFRSYFDIYLLEASSNLINWVPLPALLRTNSSANLPLYVEAEAFGYPTRFYRTFASDLPTPLPKPTGPYVTGTTSLLLTDSSRTHRYSGATNSSFMVTLWFPAQSMPGTLPATYLESKLAPGLAGLYGVSQSVLSNFYCHSFKGVAVATNHAPYPVVIYSHGFRVDRRDNTAKCEELASHGYVVVAIDHADCLVTAFPDGRLLNTTISDFSAALFTNNVLDVRFVLDTLTRMNQGDPVFRGTLDLQHVGTMGWSFGGGVAAEACRTDGRVLGTVLLDAYLQNADNVIRLGLQKPFLSMYSAGGGGTQAPFYMATRDAYWMQIQGTKHQHFADWLAWINSPTTAGRQAAVAMNACMLSFFDKYLKGQDDHLLDGPANVYPSVVNFAKK